MRNVDVNVRRRVEKWRNKGTRSYTLMWFIASYHTTLDLQKTKKKDEMNFWNSQRIFTFHNDFRKSSIFNEKAVSFRKVSNSPSVFEKVSIRFDSKIQPLSFSPITPATMYRALILKFLGYLPWFWMSVWIDLISQKGRENIENACGRYLLVGERSKKLIAQLEEGKGTAQSCLECFHLYFQISPLYFSPFPHLFPALFFSVSSPPLPISRVLYRSPLARDALHSKRDA